jgi:myo-inositol-1(or 4)-monophosphatase
MSEIAFIEESLRELGQYVRERYSVRATIAVDSKQDPNDMLTEVDLAVQKELIRRIGERFPGDAVMAEEAGKGGPPEDQASRCWIIDPIDGTQNFVRGLYPGFGISVAFAVEGDVRAAGVMMPLAGAEGDLFLAERGAGALRNGRRTYVSDVQTLDTARIEVDFASPHLRRDMLQAASEVIIKAGAIRSHGAAIVALCSIASGDADGYVHVNLQPWDYAAGLLLVEEAGGRATRFDGSAVSVFGPTHDLAASSGAFHDELLATIPRLERSTR